MKTTWLQILLLTVLSLGSLAALSMQAAENPVASPVTAPADSKEDAATEAEQKDPDGGFTPAPESEKPIELPPEMRGTADFDISFPIDI